MTKEGQAEFDKVLESIYKYLSMGCRGDCKMYTRIYRGIMAADVSDGMKEAALLGFFGPDESEGEEYEQSTDSD